MKFTKIGLALAVSVAAASANAAWETGQSGDGELILSIWNSATETSLSMDLGVNTFDAMGLALGSTFDINAAALAHIGGEAAAADLKFNVVGVNVNPTDFQTFSDPNRFSVYITQVAEPTNYSMTVATLPTSGTAIAGLESKLNDAGSLAAGSGTEDPTILLSGSLDYAGAGNVWSDNAGAFQGTYQLNPTAAAVGDSIYAYSFAPEIDPANGFPVTYEQSAGFWTVEFNTDGSAYLAYSAVPIPAAVWLFASGLLGLAGVSRRKKA